MAMKNDGLLSIGEVSAKTGVASSALRYYETEKLIRPPRRVGGKRRYDVSIVARVTMICFAKQVGFTIAELKTLLIGFDRDGLPKTWQRMATRKLEQLDADRKRISKMHAILSEALRCGCADLEACVGHIESSLS